MDSRKNSGKSGLQDERLENIPYSRHNTLYNTPAAQHEERVAQEKTINRKAGLAGIFGKLGNLPEWNVPGRGQLCGKALNNGIAWASCLAFLKFGMSIDRSMLGTRN